MAVVTLKGSRVITPNDAVPRVLGAPGTGGGAVRCWTETVETTAADDISSTYLLARLPSNARILGNSIFSWDDLSSDAAVMDIGVFNQSGKSDITDDPDALSNGHSVATAGSGNVIGDIADYGIPLWDHATGTTDPLAVLEIKATLTDAIASAAGTITMTLFYTLD